MTPAYPKSRTLGDYDKKKLKKECEDLWSEIIKFKAGYKSEISPWLTKENKAILAAHHIMGKSNVTLKYLTFQNGICLTTEEHSLLHRGNQAQREQIRHQIEEVREKSIFDDLYILKHNTLKPKMSLRIVKMFLAGELAKLKGTPS